MAHKILIADPFHGSLLEALDAENIPYTYTPEAERNEILGLLQQGYTGLVIRTKTDADAEMLQAGLPSLQFVIRGGAGMDSIDTVFAFAHKIRCFNAGAGNAVAVAEHTIGMFLALSRKIANANLDVRRGLWQREANRGIELRGRTVGIIGYGNTGSETAGLFAAFGAKVLAYDKYKSGFARLGIEEVQPERIFEEAEILSLHIPLTEETRRMLDSKYIAGFRRPFYLLNMSRGGIVCLENVNAALAQGQIQGFCTDVLENENFATFSENQRNTFESLSARSNVIFTPHIAGWTVESFEKIAGIVAGIIVEETKK